MTFHLVLLIGLLGYLLYVVAFMVRDMFWLRVIMLGALLAESVYMALPSPGEPLWLGIACNVLVFLINLYHLGLYLRDRQQARFSPAEEALYQQGLKRYFNRVDFVRLLRTGTWREAGSGEILIQEGQPVTAVYLLEQGRVAVCHGSERLALLSPGVLMGEMSYITGNVASASVMAEGAVRVLELDKARLDKLIRRHPDVETGIHAMIGHDMARKLQAA